MDSDRSQEHPASPHPEQGSWDHGVESSRSWADSIPQLIWVAAADGRTVYFNRRWFEYTGSPAEGAGAAAWGDYVHEDDRDFALAGWAQAVAAGEAFETEFRLRRAADGDFRWHLVRSEPTLDADGRVVRWVGTMADIHDRKTAEQSLRQAKDDSETAGRTKDEFLSIVSHELRTPLSAILGWTQLLEMDVLDAAETREAIQTIKQQAKAQSQLIEDLLDVSRILNGKFHLRQQQVELSRLVLAAMNAVRPVAAQSDITLRPGPWDPALVVRGDPQRLQQVIVNLLHNAVKFTPKGGTIEVTLTPADGGAKVTVRDSGLGIPVDQIEAIFERFKQVGSEAIRDKGGLGLGLSIVKHVVDAHHGTVRAISDGVGRGSRFEMTLPTLAVATATDRPHPSTDLAPGEAALLGIRVLVVDDEESARTVIAASLGKAGASVTTARDAAEAWTLLSAEPFHVLVSDLGMPVETGVDLITRVRRVGVPFRGIPAIALTGFASVDDQTQALAAGFQVHVSKPVDPTELVRRILHATQSGGKAT